MKSKVITTKVQVENVIKSVFSHLSQGRSQKLNDYFVGEGFDTLDKQVAYTVTAYEDAMGMTEKDFRAMFSEELVDFINDL